MMMRQQQDGCGYLFVDNRANHGGVEEADIVLCPHCETTINLQKWRNQTDWEKYRKVGGGGYCHKCEAPICGMCLDRLLTHGCEPAKKRIDKSFERVNRIRQNLMTMR